jgi:hypothetical protein
MRSLLCACVFEVAACSACCVMLRVPLAHVYTKWRVLLPVVLCCVFLLRMYIQNDGLYCLLCYAARPSCACIYEVADCSACCVHAARLVQSAVFCAIILLYVESQRTTQHYIPVDSNLRNLRCGNLKFYMFISQKNI